MNNRLNKYKYPGAKRLMLEAQELREKTEDYCAQPIDDNLFEWHFTVRGPPETAFEGGFYHGRLSFPTEYPMKPPSIILLTPNGRFETNKKICLSISGYHPETWQPSWSVRTALLALIAFMPTKANRAIGSLDYADPERKKLARNSRTWRCETCGPIRELLKPPESSVNSASNQSSSGSSHQCEDGAGTSRVENMKSGGGGGCCLAQSDGSQDGKSDRSDSDGEIRDNSTTDSQSSTSTNGSDVDGEPIATIATTTTAIIKQPQQQRNEDNPRDRQVNDLGVVINDEETSGSNLDSNQQHTTCQDDSNQSLGLNLHNSEQITTTTTSATTIIPAETRRSYPPQVFVSIFILLFLLILRRIVITIQS